MTKILRPILYRLEKALQAIRFASLSFPKDGWPVLLGISFPKSGTHLLDQVLLGFSKVAPFARHLHSSYAEYEGATGLKRSTEQAIAWLKKLRPLDVASAHLFARPEVVAHVTSTLFLPYFIYRDPRDVVVSHVFYVTEMETDHVHHRYYKEHLQSFDERLMVSILGLPNSTVEFPNIGERFSFYLNWLDTSQVLPLQFESFILDRDATLKKIAMHFVHRVETLENKLEEILSALASSIQPQKSPTFRSGKVGEWRKYFTEAHKRAFKDVAGDLLIRLGYERDKNW